MIQVSADDTYLPVLLDRKKEADNQVFQELVNRHSTAILVDHFPSQKQEIFKILNPKKRLSPAELEELYTDFLTNKNPDLEGTWVFYPWLNKLIHTLSREEFIQLRTSRNQYRISQEEQNTLSDKKIGIIGLSIGHSVALSIATERICGKMKLADFDILELSNLNRIRTGIQNIGLNKCIFTAREIAQIDPFLEIECYTEGIHDGNLNEFMLGGGKLDILVDECDGLEIKISAREEAKKYQIPVIMETSDRGMLDVERFDLETERPIFHGLISDIPAENLKNIPPEARIPLVLKIVDAINGSTRGKVSMLEVGQTISTWPQLASAATLGGAVVTDVSRRILLKQFSDSGRYYVDLENIISDKNSRQEKPVENPEIPFDLVRAIHIADTLPVSPTGTLPEMASIEQIVEAAGLAPSSANDQPWKWLYRNGRLHLFHDTFRSHSFANFDDNAAYTSFGAAYEHILLQSHKLGLKVKAELFPKKEFPDLIALFQFPGPDLPNAEPVFSPESADFIHSRSTNRSPSPTVVIPEEDYLKLRTAVESVDGAQLHYVTERARILGISKIIGECDRMMIFHRHGHHHFFEKALRWPAKNPLVANDGIDLRSMGLAPAQIAAITLVKDQKIARTLKEIGGGNALVESSMFAPSTSSGLGLITLPAYNKENFFKGGIAMERMWLMAEKLGYAIHPMMSPLSLFPRLGKNTDLDSDEVEKLAALRKSFLQIMNHEGDLAEVFLFKIAKADKPAIKSNRLPLDEILFIANKEK
jgi:molybdopterin/thiamine biosynthesis adenylyltransferase/nitroreductase